MLGFYTVLDGAHVSLCPALSSALSHKITLFNHIYFFFQPKGDILEQIAAQRRLDVAAAKAVCTVADLEAQVKAANLPTIDFATRLRSALPTCVLAEVKR